MLNIYLHLEEPHISDKGNIDCVDKVNNIDYSNRTEQ